MTVKDDEVKGLLPFILAFLQSLQVTFQLKINDFTPVLDNEGKCSIIVPGGRGSCPLLDFYSKMCSIALNINMLSQ